MLLRSTFDVDLIQTMGSDEMVARAARVSTGRDQLEQEKIEGLIGYLARENHTTPFESCTATFRVTAPMFVVQQILRHRTLSYSALSHRYTEATPEFYVPDPDRPLKNAGSSAHPNLVADDSITYGEVLSLHEGAVKDAWDYYVCLIELGVANEVARNVLPANLYTSLYMTGNLLNWIKFLRLRNGTHGHPQYEIAEVANEIQYQLTKKFPLSMTAFFQGESE